MTVKMADVPVEDRPRERLLRCGVAALSDAELVAIQLGSGSAGTSALELSQALLAGWGGMAGLAAARPEELSKVPGVGPAKAARLIAAFGLAAKLDTPRDAVKLASSADIARAAQPRISHSRVEQVLALIADGGLHLKRTEVVAIGSAKSCPMPVREILATVLRHDGVAFAVAHNHPGGDPTPTGKDLAATAALEKAALATGLRFLDHVVVVGRSWRGTKSPTT
jgi:DNA repair protein RadC